MCSMWGRLQCHPYTLNIHFPKVAHCIIIGNELELYYWNDRLNYGLGKYSALCKAVVKMVHNFITLSPVPAHPGRT